NPMITYGGCYGGSIERHDHTTGHSKEIMAWPQMAVGRQASDLRFRFQWNAPIRISPHDPTVLYHCSNVVHRTRDEGHSWQVISPDLSRNDRSRQGYAGEPITRDNTGVEVYGTIFAFEPSPHRAGLLWAGTDDGRLHISDDEGAHWREITPKAMPEAGQVNMIELSAHGAGRALMAVTRYRSDDFAPYIFLTDDFGNSWKPLTNGRNGIPEDYFVRVVREDPDRKGLLYAGTEFGLFVSFDEGRRWQPLQLNLPATPITDLALSRRDLVVATQGRGFWILDDVTPLHEISPELAAAPIFLFGPRETFRWRAGGEPARGAAVGKNPPAGAIIHYVLAQEPDAELMLEMLDDGGHVLRRFSSVTPERRAPDPWARYVPERAEPKLLPAKAGMNRFVWDLRLPDAEIASEAVLWGSARGPLAVPGAYEARLTLGQTRVSRRFTVVADPRLSISAEQLDEQYRFTRRVWKLLSESHRGLKRVRDLGRQIDELVQRLDKSSQAAALATAAEAVRQRLDEIAGRLHQGSSEAAQDVLNFPPRLDNQLVALLGAIDSADAPPTSGMIERLAELEAELEHAVRDIDHVVANEIAAFDALVRKVAPGAVIDPARVD
ncbi:MAG: exo-alpha-sialidase, partial [Acidobacteriota bacterium]